MASMWRRAMLYLGLGPDDEYDDGYAPPKTLEQTRRLVEQDRVAFEDAQKVDIVPLVVDAEFVAQRRVTKEFIELVNGLRRRRGLIDGDTAALGKANAVARFLMHLSE